MHLLTFIYIKKKVVFTCTDRGTKDGENSGNSVPLLRCYLTNISSKKKSKVNVI